MFGKLTTEIVVTVKAGTNDETQFKDKKELTKWLEQKIVEFEMEQNKGNVRVHVEPYEGCGC